MLQEAWDNAIAALPKLSVCACGYKHFDNLEYDHEYVHNSLEGWMLEVSRYPQPSTFDAYDHNKNRRTDDRGNQWHISAKPAIDSQHQNTITVRAPDQIRGLVRMAELLSKVVVMNPYGWMIQVKEDYCRDMYEED